MIGRRTSSCYPGSHPVNRDVWYPKMNGAISLAPFRSIPGSWARPTAVWYRRPALVVRRAGEHPGGLGPTDAREPSHMTTSPVEHLDVLIIGAGISGIGAAHYLHRDHPDRTYAVLEGRAAGGG